MIKVINLFISLSFTLLITSCGGNNSNIKATDEAQIPAAEQKTSYTLPDGSTVNGYKRRSKTGYYVGSLRNKQPHGRGVFVNDKNTVSVGNYINGKADGLHKYFNLINGLVTYNLIKDGKSLQVYGELDALLASGDFEAAAKTRGKRVFLGIQLKDGSPYIKAIKIIKNSPADLAGVKADDQLLAINQIPLLNRTVSFALQSLIRLPYDKPLQLKVNRDGTTRIIKMIPGIIPASHPGATASARLLWNKVKAENSSSGYQHYIDTISDEQFKKQAQKKLAILLTREKHAFQQIKNKGDQGLTSFCNNYPYSSLLAEALSSHFKIIENSKNFYSRYDNLVRQCPRAVKFQPASYQLLSVGPAQMTIADILRLTQKGMSSTLISTKIKTSDQSYKDFDLDEISQLNAFGVHDEIIAAMIETTYNKKKADEIQSRLKKLEEENRQLKATQNRQVQANNQENIQQQEKNNMPLECVKLAAALKACDEASGFLSMGCKAVAKSQFDCPIPLN